MRRRHSRPREFPALVAFGRQMRRMREGKGVKQEAIAHLTSVSGPQVSRIEAGKKRATRSFVEIGRSSGGGRLADQPLGGLEQGRPPGADLVRLAEDRGDAAMLVCWEHSVIPGLVQTPGYASAILHGNQEAVDTRLGRQNILARDDGTSPPILSLLIDEQVLRRPVGASETMREQLEHLVAASSLPNVTVQVVLESGEHDGSMGAFVVATMDDRSEIAYVETAIRALTTDDPADLAVLARTLVDLRSRALTQQMSRELIIKVAQEKWI